MLNIKLWTKLYFDSLIPNCHEKTQPVDKHSADLPSEIRNISLLNSIIVCENDMDDYEGEETKCEPSLVADIDNEINPPLFPVKTEESFSVKILFLFLLIFVHVIFY